MQRNIRLAINLVIALSLALLFFAGGLSDTPGLNASVAVAAQERTPTPTARPRAPGDITRSRLVQPPVATPGGTLPGNPQIQLVKVADGLVDPINVVSPPDDSGRLFVVERHGVVRIVQDGELLEEPFLDISGDVLSAFLEQGLYDLAFHPDFANNGTFYLHFAELLRNGDSMIVEYQVSEDDPNRADPDSARAILQIDQPWANHNGGELAFGPDGYLYIGSGDGGWEGDPLEAGQNLGTLLGKILRIDVNTEGVDYAIPEDNPFAANLELVRLFGISELEFARIHTEARPEIWAYGLRNPWKFSFDSETGDLYIAEVGQNHWEEINFQPADSQGGENYGWDFLMGSHCFPIQEESCPNVGILPVAEYSHDDGDCAVVGVDVYRGDEFPELQGIYFAGDFCSGRVRGLTRTEDGDWAFAELLDTSLKFTGGGRGQDGSLYMTSCECGYGSGTPTENPPGSLWRIVAADAVPRGAETAPLEEGAAEHQHAGDDGEGGEGDQQAQGEDGEAQQQAQAEAGEAHEHDVPLIAVSNQPVQDQTITVRETVVEGPSFLVVYTVNEEGQLTRAIGRAHVEDGETYNVTIDLRRDVSPGSRLAVVLFEDRGNVGEFEFSSGNRVDRPVQENGQVVMSTFRVTEAQAEAEATPARPTQTATPAAEAAAAGQGEVVRVDLVAENFEFSKNSITVPPGAHVIMEFTNQDRAPHNFAAYVTDAAQDAIFVGRIITGPDRTVTYEFDAPSEPGNYYFQCDVHPSTMTGQFIVEQQ